MLSAFVALSPLATDMYLPAMPVMAEAFAAGPSQLQLTLSLYLAGFSLFHLVCGPLSDRYGRKPIMLGGMFIFFIACLGCSSATSVEQLILWRFLQGVGACVGPTLARAMVRDMYSPFKLSKALASMNAIMALVPILAPILGGWMLLIMPWPGIFIFMAAYSLLAMFVLMAKVPESLPEPQSVKLRHVGKNYLVLLRNSEFCISVIAASLLYSGAFAFVSSSSFILIDFMGVPGDQFGYWFTFIVVGYASGNIFTARYAQRFEPHRLMTAGALLGFSTSVIMIVLYLYPIYHPLTLVLPVALFTCSIGITLPQAMARALEPFPNMAGTASALMGFIQMGAASIVAAIAGVFVTGEPMPLALILAGCSALSFILFCSLKK